MAVLYNQFCDLEPKPIDVSFSVEGLKVEKAQEFKVPVLNVVWLTELFLGFHTAAQNLNIPKYRDFSLQGDPFRLDPAYFLDQIPVVMNLMSKLPTQLSTDKAPSVDRQENSNKVTGNFPTG